MMMTAGVHAAGDVDGEFTHLIQLPLVGEPALNGLGDGNGFGVGQRAEIAAGAADHIGELVQVMAVQVARLQPPPQVGEPALLHIRQHHILTMGHPQFAETELIGKIGDHLHLPVGDIPGGDAGLLQSHGDDGVSRPLVRAHIMLEP